MRNLRIVLIALSIAFIVIPAAIVGITGNGWSGLTAHILISLSISSLMGAILIGINKNNKSKFYTNIGVCVGLLLVLLSLWLK